MRLLRLLLPLAAACCLGGEDLVMDLRDWPVRIGPEAQLFVDGYLIARRSDVDFRVHQPVKHAANPLIVPTPPGESLVLAYGSVLRGAAGRLRMWYTNQTGIAYAESDDGVRWEKPGIGLELDGRKTNLLTRGHRGRSDTLSVFLNPDQRDPLRRFLAYPMEYRFPDKDGVRETRREGIYLRASPDGIHWTERPDPVMYAIWRDEENRPGDNNAGLGDVHHISWDPKLNKFMGHIKVARQGIRMRALVESDDGIYWSKPELILAADAQDRPGDQIYSMVAFPYESMWLAFIGLYHKGTDERMDIQLASSRDGRHWSRPLRSTFLPNGREGSFDWGVMHMAGNAPIRSGGALSIYYDGLGSQHNVKLRDTRKMGIGLATLRPDGFVSLDAGPRGGRVITRPLNFDGSRLRLNAAVKPGGGIRVRLLDGAERPISGCAETEVTGDALDLAASCDFTPSKGRNVRLEFAMRDASLYSFRIE
ncbi:MAG TPA: hypothetical protein VL285_21135 [Bryobacteraceae bacterium]|jgi:hypothetical protein|nr:hypothetical protein [Bryobacteraceae bacterium]